MPKMTKLPKMPKIEDEYHFIFKKVERAYSAEKATKAKSDSTLRHSIFDILRFCGSLFIQTFERLKPISDRLCPCSGPALLPARARRSDCEHEKFLSPRLNGND
jgi:hypothetical protein